MFRAQEIGLVRSRFKYGSVRGVRLWIPKTVVVFSLALLLCQSPDSVMSKALRLPFRDSGLLQNVGS